MSVDRNKCESSYPYNIAQSRTYKPATSAWGCNTVSLNTDSTQTMKRGQKWAYCVEAPAKGFPCASYLSQVIYDILKRLKLQL